MKLLVKYYDQWGNPASVVVSITSKGQVQDLKASIQQHTQIASHNQEITLILENNVKVLLDGDSDYLSQYQFTKNTVVLVKKLDDEFSQSFQSLRNSIVGSKHGSTADVQVYADSSLSLQNPFASEVTVPSPEQHHHTLELFYGAIRTKNLNMAKNIYMQNHNAYVNVQGFSLINDVSYAGWSAMHLSVFCGHETIFLWLLGEGGDINQETQDGWNCLTIAVWQKQLTLLALILGQVGLNINKITKQGSAMHLAAKLDDGDVIRMLLKHPNISLDVIDQNNLRPINMAGSVARHIFEKESGIEEARKSFIESMSSTSFNGNISLQSFIANRPQRPPLICGVVQKVNYFKLTMYSRFMIVDPDTGVLARFKHNDDIPLNPNEIIPLESVNDIRLAKNEWFQLKEYLYIEIKYANKHIYIALQHKNSARQWYETLRNSVGYVKYITCKLNAYQVNNEPRKQKSNIKALMMEKQNQVIMINDELGIDQKSYLQQQQEKNRVRFRQSLDSVTEDSYLEEDNDEIELSVEGSFVYQSKLQRTILKIKDFEIIDHAGKGSFGNVYKARLKQNNRIFALKQQDKDKLIATNQLKYVQGELSILQKLHHPFIINLYYSFQTPFYLYLALDFCPKGDLSRYMTRGKILDEFTAKFIIAQVILALEDLKPENVLLDDSGYIKLIDFGLSKEGKISEFIATSFCGSPAYLSPELIAGHGTSKATDIYSIGTILYEMLTGYPPFFCNNLQTLLHNIRYSKLILPKNISQPAQNLLKKLLEKLPEARLGYNDITVLKKHIFFAEIDWDKLIQRKYIPTKMGIRDIKSRSGNQSYTAQQHFDLDYREGDTKANYVEKWDFSVGI